MSWLFPTEREKWRASATLARPGSFILKTAFGLFAFG